jgi:hypothetical protein
LQDNHARVMILSETLQMTTITDKLSPFWKDFKNLLGFSKHIYVVEIKISNFFGSPNNPVS